MTTAQLKETPLASTHRKLGAKMVDFAGWNMPVQYSSIVAEHKAVRSAVGVFDVSHMGEFIVTGPQAHEFVQYMVANDVNKLSKPNMAQYTQFVMPTGGTVDDLIVYRRENDYLLVVNAGNLQKDWEWVKQYAKQFSGVTLKDASDQTALLALQGPKAVELLSELAGGWVKELPSFNYGEAEFDGMKISFGRTGYTGEDGFEILVDNAHADKLWTTLLERGQKHGILPCGLGARDTLRLEAGLPLYGHELDEHTSPLEAGLGWSVKLDKGDFLGAEALRKQKQQGLSKQLVCLKSEGKAAPRQHYAVFDGDKAVGEVTSGAPGVWVGYPIAFAFVEPSCAAVGKNLSIAIRDNMVPAQVVKRPWYRR